MKQYNDKIIKQYADGETASSVVLINQISFNIINHKDRLMSKFRSNNILSSQNKILLHWACSQKGHIKQ
jgi:hypothetical protein